MADLAAVPRPGFDRDRGHLLRDLVADGEEVNVAHGGRGGRGNKAFATAVNAEASDGRRLLFDGRTRREAFRLEFGRFGAFVIVVTHAPNVRRDHFFHLLVRSDFCPVPDRI